MLFNDYLTKPGFGAFEFTKQGFDRLKMVIRR